MASISDYNLIFQIKSATLQVLADKTKKLFPSLEPEKALHLTLISILQSLQMDFHPQDLLFPAISGSSDADFQAVQLILVKSSADSLAKYFIENSLTSYADFRTEIRKRILDAYELLQQFSPNKIHI